MASPAGHPADAQWPAWTVAVGLVAGGLGGQIAATLVIAPLAIGGAGSGDVTGVGMLLASAAFGAALLATIALLVRRTQPLSASALGLRRAALGPALAWVALAGALIAAFVFFWAHVVDLSSWFSVPSELDGRTSLAEQLGVGRPPEQADPGVGAIASALGRVVVPAVLAEVVLRGFALQALARWRGELVALAITSFLTLAPAGFAIDASGGGATLLPICLLLGGALGILFRLTDSLLPGIALSAIVMGAGLGASFAWSAAGVALLAAACGAAALALALPLALRRA